MRSSQNRPLKRRIEVVFILAIACFLALALRLTWIQGIRQRYFTQLADRIHVRRIPSPAERGVVRDRKLRELAANVQAADISANPRAVTNREQAVQAVLQLVGGNPALYEKRLAEPKLRFVYLARGVPREKGQQLMEQGIPGLEARGAPKRVHPFGPLAAHVLGYTDTDGIGLEGIELAQDRVLRGRDGHIVAEVDATQNTIPDTEREVVHPVDGKDVVLTLDANIQQFAEDALARVAEEEHPESATAIVMDVRTGEILGMANLPTYDPNQRGNVPVENRRNRAITDLYEPGSTFKTITAAAMLEAGLNTSIYCPGTMGVGRRTIHCAHGASHGHQELMGVIEHSCNVGAGTWGLRLGPERLYENVKRFGFLEPTRIELRGETVGGLMKPDRWAPMKTANVAFGQGVVATPLQMLRAYAAIANDGVLPTPTILRSIGGVRQHPKTAPRRVISAAAAARLRDALTLVVTGGTGKLAKIANYSVAGKTGTAQLARNGIYVHGAYVSSFIGFLPAGASGGGVEPAAGAGRSHTAPSPHPPLASLERVPGPIAASARPRIAILVAVTWPKAHQYGGTVAAPAFREIARQTMNYLEIPPDAPGDSRDGSRPVSGGQGLQTASRDFSATAMTETVKTDE
jgi:stage V sporulation protein D (sporulation-specific penicillin-binding protein)